MVPVIFVNGCFDLITVAHVRLLTFASSLGERLIIGLNGDESVKTLKGHSRPLNNEYDRREVLRRIKGVHEVYIFDDTNCSSLLRKIKPNIWVKGGDYKYETINPLELKVAQEIGCEIRFFSFFEGYSTTSIIAKINSNKLVKTPLYEYKK